MVFSLNSPLELDPILLFRLLNDVLLQRLSTDGSHGALMVIVQDGWYLVIASDVFLCRISG